MSGVEDGASQASGSASRTADAPSGEPAQPIGAYLSAQRRLRGISVEELAQQTRIPLRSLQRLESGLLDADVDGFVRGFVRTVAQALGLDPDETLNRTLKEPGRVSDRRVSSHLSVRRVVATVLGLVLLAGVGFAVQLIAVSFTDAPIVSRSRSPIVVRRDPVRALAEAQGIAGLSPAPALALASGAANETASEGVTEVNGRAPEPSPADGSVPDGPDSDRGAAPVAGR